MQYIVILSLIIILCVSIYLSSFKQIESFENSEEENYLRQYKNKLNTLKKLLEQYAKDAETNFMKARETKNNIVRTNLAIRNNTLLDSINILNTIPLLIVDDSRVNSPEYTIDDFEKDFEGSIKATLTKLRSAIAEKEQGPLEEEDEEEDDDDTTYEKVAAQERAAEAARLAEAEAERIRIEEDIRLAEQVKKEELANAKQSLINKFNDFDALLNRYKNDDNDDLINMVLSLMCKISQRLKNIGTYFNQNDPQYVYRFNTLNMSHGFKKEDVVFDDSTVEWKLNRIYNAPWLYSSYTGQVYEGKYFLDLSTIKNPLEEVFPPLNINTLSSPVNSKSLSVRPTYYSPMGNGEYVIYRLILIYKELYKNYLIIEGFKNIDSNYDYKKLKLDIESVDDDLEKIKQLQTILDTKVLKLSELLSNFMTFVNKITLYAWFIMFPYNWESYYSKTIPADPELIKNLFCCDINDSCKTDFEMQFLPINWTFYLQGSMVAIF
jgi:hypothetical protein